MDVRVDIDELVVGGDDQRTGRDSINALATRLTPFLSPDAVAEVEVAVARAIHGTGQSSTSP